MSQIKLLNTEEITCLYNTHMKIDFPPDELKPLEIILSLIQKGVYECLGLFEAKTLKAYAFIAREKDGQIYLLDYLAVCEIYRNQGYGSHFLALLKTYYPNAQGLIIEVESLRTAHDTKDFQMRTRRLNFYKRNGLMQTDVTTNCFNVEFTILYLPITCPYEHEFIYKHLACIYKTIFPAHLYEANVRFL
ncbi:GNAT family N-acetyltransferase [Cellulosilyticum ruminicola]|uniref:GNAT family N-acetyltransferase n=1 Tax=Cellulosilyticum ruminicola TaxID=425254 RepID=UPI0006D00FAA|nr:GNAT family N-acetyltransferase [Cellulosilyticum ruminicola]